MWTIGPNDNHTVSAASAIQRTSGCWGSSRSMARTRGDTTSSRPRLSARPTSRRVPSVMLIVIGSDMETLLAGEQRQQDRDDVPDRQHGGHQRERATEW